MSLIKLSPYIHPGLWPVAVDGQVSVSIGDGAGLELHLLEPRFAARQLVHKVEGNKQA